MIFLDAALIQKTLEYPGRILGKQFLQAEGKKVLTSKKTQSVSITKICWLMLLFKNIISVYSENGKKPISTLWMNAVLH
jgi:hypothetical protein